MYCILPSWQSLYKRGDLGFPVPNIKNSELCAGCGICIKACHFSDEFEEDE